MKEHVIYVVMRRHADGDSVACWRQTQAEAEAVVEALEGRRPSDVRFYWIKFCSDVPSELEQAALQ